MEKYMIETENLTKNGRISDVDLRVPEKCIYGFLGPNGAGKTTTLKLLLGLIHPDNGIIRYNGVQMESKNRHELLKLTGSLIESPSYYGHLTGWENMGIVAHLKKQNENEARRVLEEVGLYTERNKKVSHYSLGMKQRLGLAMALMGSPEILILDEPINGLDPAGIQEMRELIRGLPEKYGMTVIISSHLLSEVEQMADQVGIIHHGSLIWQGNLSALDPSGTNLESVFLELTS